MDAIKDTVNSALEKLNITGGAPQGTPAKEPTEEQLNELKAKYQKAGQEQVFVSAARALVLQVWEHLAGLCEHCMACSTPRRAPGLVLITCMFTDRRN